MLLVIKCQCLGIFCGVSGGAVVCLICIYNFLPNFLDITCMLRHFKVPGVLLLFAFTAVQFYRGYMGCVSFILL